MLEFLKKPGPFGIPVYGYAIGVVALIGGIWFFKRHKASSNTGAATVAPQVNPQFMASGSDTAAPPYPKGAGMPPEPPPYPYPRSSPPTPTQSPPMPPFATGAAPPDSILKQWPRGVPQSASFDPRQGSVAPPFSNFSWDGGIGPQFQPTQSQIYAPTLGGITRVTRPEPRPTAIPSR